MADQTLKSVGIQDNAMETSSGTETLVYATAAGSPTIGSTDLDQTANNGTATDRYVWLEFIKGGTETPTTCTLDWRYNVTAFNSLTTGVGNTDITIILKKPDTTEVTLDGPIAPTTTSTAWQLRTNINLTESDFSQTGTYQILIRQRAAFATHGADFHVDYDTCELTIDTTSAITHKMLGISDNQMRTSSGNETLTWQTADGDPTNGCTELDQTAMAGTSTDEYDLYEFEKTGSVSGDVTLDVKSKVATIDATEVDLEYFLVQPDATEVSIGSRLNVSTADTVFVNTNITIANANFSQDGVYHIMVRQTTTH
jgi:hypothetical protein